MAGSQDRNGRANGDVRKDAAGEDADQQSEAPAAVPEDKPRRPRLFGYDPDHWPEPG